VRSIISGARRRLAHGAARIAVLIVAIGALGLVAPGLAEAQTTNAGQPAVTAGHHHQAELTFSFVADQYWSNNPQIKVGGQLRMREHLYTAHWRLIGSDHISCTILGWQGQQSNPTNLKLVCRGTFDFYGFGSLSGVTGPFWTGTPQILVRIIGGTGFFWGAHGTDQLTFSQSNENISYHRVKVFLPGLSGHQQRQLAGAMN
jgi:hypothetical protein